jgi:hypothetical protein
MLGSTARDGGNDAQFVPCGDRGCEVVEVADVLVVEVDVDESAELCTFEDTLLQLRELRPEVTEDLADRGTLGFDHILAAGVRAERGGDSDLRHGVDSF